MPNPPSGTISIAATFTAEPLLPALSFMLEQAGIPLDVSFAPYNQVFQELLSDTRLLARNNKGVNVILVRIEDFVRDISDEDIAIATVTRTTEEMCVALASFARHSKVTTIVSILDPSPLSGRLQSTLEGATATLVTKVRSLPGMVLLYSNDIAKVFAGERFDIVSDELAHIPFTKDFFASLAIGIVRNAHASLIPPHKVLALDCDNTLWRGVVGEDGVDGLKLPTCYTKLQQFAIEAHSRGVLICLVSKNSENDVLDVFERRHDMLLKSDHVVAHRINWESKPKNIISLANELNLGLESFVFIDDNPVECALMQSELPQVVTLQLPPEDNIDAFLANLWVFDKTSITDEDLRRTELYKQEAARQASEAQATDIADFIASLGVEVDIRAPTEKEWARLAQLTLRTNQFNFTTRRRTEAELRAMAGDGALIQTVSVKDRFGDYGLVGLIVAQFEPKRLVVDTFLLSCRVLGRGVEHAIIRQLGHIACARDLALVAIPFIHTAKNEPAHAFIDSVASRFRTSEDRQDIFLIPAQDACEIAHRPGFDPKAVIQARSDRKPTADAKVQNCSDRYVLLAQLVSGSAVNAAVERGRHRPRDLTNRPTAPTNELEARLLVLWGEILAIDGLGIDDDYFAVGGTSLAAAQLFTEIARRFRTKLPLSMIVSSPTVRTLARQIGSQAATAGLLVELHASAQAVGSLRNLFLVHDGDGETLLYTNLARRMTNSVRVIGVNPRRANNVPLAHTRIEDMASYYIDEIRRRQPHGPYLLGGMCAGGVIAYEMANQLVQQGEKVDYVFLLDAATPQAQRRPFLATRARLGRLSDVLQAPRSTGLIGHLLKVTSGASRKAWNFVSWETTETFRKWTITVRFQLLHLVLTRGRPWPSAIPTLSVREIYEGAEAAYVPTEIAGSSVVLVRASKGEAGDTPYVNIYSGETLGWSEIVSNLTILDVDGGHYSMLQEPFVDHLARSLAQLFASPANVRQVSAPVNEPV
jgi:FkbH-like protein